MKENRRKIKRTILKIVRIFGWIWLGLIALLLLVSLAIQIPFVQNALVQRVVSFAEGKIGTPVSLDRIAISFPKRVVLEGIYVEDQQNDTLLYAGRLGVDADMFALLSRRIQLNEIKLEHVTANVARTKEGVFNFDYIVESFSGEEVPQEPAGPGWDFVMREIVLETIAIKFDDESGGNDVALALTNLHIRADVFDLSANVFDLAEVTIDGLDSQVRMYAGSATPAAATGNGDTTAGTGLVIAVQDLNLKGIGIQYADDVGGTTINLDLGQLRLADHELNLAERTINGETLRLSDTFVAFHRVAEADSLAGVIGEDSIPSSSPDQAWKFALDKLVFENNSLQYYDFTSPRGPAGFDPAHVWITGLKMDVDGIAVAEDQYAVRVNELSFQESGGFRLNNLTADIRVDSTDAIVDNFDLATSNSHLRFNLRSTFPSLATPGKDLKQVSMVAGISDSYIGMADLALLSPSSLPLHLPDTGRVAIAMDVSGVVDDIAIAGLAITALNGTALRADGNIRNVSNPGDLWFDIQLEEFRTTSDDVIALLPDTLLPESLSLPAWVMLTGKFSGTPLKPDVLADLNSAFGAVHLDAVLDFDSTSGQGYAGTVKVSQFDLGQLIRQENMGVLDLEGSVKGEGMTMDDIDVYANVKVNEFEFNDYVYRDLSVDGKLDKNIFRGNATMNDPNLQFDLKGDLDYGYAGEQKQYHFDLDLRRVDLQALNFLDRPLDIAFQLSVDLDDANPGNLNGGLAIHDATFNTGEEIFRIDSFLVASINQEGNSSLNIDSDFIRGEFTGTFDLLSLPTVLRQHFSNYYALTADSTETNGDVQQFGFELELRNTSFLTEVIMPDLERIDPGEIRGAFDSNDGQLDLSIVINALDHKSVKATDINFEVQSSRRQLEYEFTASNIVAGALTVPQIAFDGTVAGDSIETGIVISDSAKEERYVIRGIFRSLEDAYQFSLLPDYLVLNYDAWTVPDDNAILVGRRGFAAEHLDLAFEEQKISIRAPVGGDSTLNVTLERLDLQGLLNIAFSDTLVSGKLGGEINLHGSDSRGPLEATIDITDLAVDSEPMGDLNVVVNQPLPGRTTLKVNGTGPGIDMLVEGTYDAQPGLTPGIQFNADIQALNLQAVQPFVWRQVSGLKGNLKSSLSVQGSPDTPDIDGSLTLEDATLVPSYTGSVLKLNNETIRFRGSTLSLNKFTLRDEVDNTLVLDGRVMVDELYTLDLTATARNFQLLNTVEGENDLFYGQVWLNTTAQIKGTLDHPEIDMTVGLGEKSNFTFIIPQSEAGVMASEGIVIFVDRDKPEDPKAIDARDTLAVRAPFQGITLTSRIELSGAETFTIVLDPLTEDKLVVNGEATLTLDIDATGDVSLSGRYELTKGTYDFTFYKLVKRNFIIEPGSTIVWNGEPLNAELGITARYRVEASPIDLLAAQMQEGADLDQYRPRLPFLVFLNIRGDLLRPEISFSLDMPDQQQGAMGGAVYAKIQDINTRESDLNKQVFALLILQRFVADNPFESQGGGTIKAAARTSVNRMLSDQLNRMAQNIEGVELTFDLQSFEEYEDGRTSGRTQLQLGLSKRLLDDRLVVKLSGNVDIEGGQGQDNNLTDYIGDLALEYKLTEDGRFRINGFYNSDYDMIDGELKEAGVGLIYIKDYDSLRELFRPNEQTNK